MWPPWRKFSVPLRRGEGTKEDNWMAVWPICTIVYISKFPIKLFLRRKRKVTSLETWHTVFARWVWGGQKGHSQVSTKNTSVFPQQVNKFYSRPDLAKCVEFSLKSSSELPSGNHLELTHWWNRRKNVYQKWRRQKTQSVAQRFPGNVETHKPDG